MVSTRPRRPRSRSGVSGKGLGPLPMLRLYGARAEHYDAELAPFEPLRAMAIERLLLRPGQLVLDVGCGTGLSLEPLLRRLGPKGKVVGIDQCSDMLAKAKERLASRKDALDKQVKLIHSPVDQARWAGPKADAALFHFTHDILQHPASVANVLAHLKPGARVVATGLQWAPPWLVPVNLAVMGCALYSVSSLHGLLQPWRGLANGLDDVDVDATWMGSIFIASGNVPSH
ncbi:class I SAM-dependent methyltransferase [Hydrogenophaga sp. 5NK40-0174]|uniref:class I SAM-dependent methyltransferase n=1 Tax=Hydrogenophaga sp. 5NK40-0174 TaxID=3127649 RepID=UPI003101C743